MIPDKAVDALARHLALLDDGDPWPTNAQLGGSMTGTRDDEFRAGKEEEAREILTLVYPFIAAQALRDQERNLAYAITHMPVTTQYEEGRADGVGYASVILARCAEDYDLEAGQ